MPGRQVLDDGVDRRLLVGRLVEAEAFGESLVVVQLERERVALAGRALRVQVEELGCRVVRLPRRALFRPVPLVAAELVQWRRFGRRAAVATDQVQVGDRDVELRLVGVEKLQEFRGTLAQVHRDEAEVAADAVLLVDDRIADAHFGEVAQHRVDIGAARRVAPAAAYDAGIELRLGDEGEPGLGPREALMERRDDQRAAAVAGNERAPVVGERHVQPVFGEVLLHRLAAPRALGADQHAAVAGSEVALERGERILRPPVDLDRRECGRSG